MKQPLKSLQSFKSSGLTPWPLTPETFGFRSDNDLAQFAALRCGLGIGGCQHGIARNYPDLMPVLPKLIRFELEMWVVMHEGMRWVPRVRRLFDHLDSALTAFLRA